MFFISHPDLFSLPTIIHHYCNFRYSYILSSAPTSNFATHIKYFHHYWFYFCHYLAKLWIMETLNCFKMCMIGNGINAPTCIPSWKFWIDENMNQQIQGPTYYASMMGHEKTLSITPRNRKYVKYMIWYTLIPSINIL